MPTRAQNTNEDVTANDGTANDGVDRRVPIDGAADSAAPPCGAVAEPAPRGAQPAAGATSLSGIRPTGSAHLGNYLGALRTWAAEGAASDLYFVSDLHAMTTAHHPGRLRSATRQQLALLLASGIDERLVFVQSDVVAELGALNWLLECTCTLGEATRMTQFKEKAGKHSTDKAGGDGASQTPAHAGRDGEPGGSGDAVRLGLLTYPVLMSADILLQGAHQVPVGADQRQHVELARALARRFNRTYGEVFAVPEAVVPRTGSKIGNLAEPGRKMAKSAGPSSGTVDVLDEPDLVRRKVSRAVTDGLGQVRHAPDEQPGVANLLEILAACEGGTPHSAANGVDTYAALKERVAEDVVEELRPVRERARELLDDPAELDRVRARGAQRASERGRQRLEAAKRLVGL